MIVVLSNNTFGMNSLFMPIKGCLEPPPPSSSCKLDDIFNLFIFYISKNASRNLGLMSIPPIVHRVLVILQIRTSKVSVKKPQQFISIQDFYFNFNSSSDIIIPKMAILEFPKKIKITKKITNLILLNDGFPCESCLSSKSITKRI